MSESAESSTGETLGGLPVQDEIDSLRRELVAGLAVRSGASEAVVEAIVEAVIRLVGTLRASTAEYPELSDGYALAALSITADIVRSGDVPLREGM